MNWSSEDETMLPYESVEGTIVCKNVFEKLDGSIGFDDPGWTELQAFAMRNFQRAPVKVIATKETLRFYF